jgi:hypothetical protein
MNVWCGEGAFWSSMLRWNGGVGGEQGVRMCGVLAVGFVVVANVSMYTLVRCILRDELNWHGYLCLLSVLPELGQSGVNIHNAFM